MAKNIKVLMNKARGGSLEASLEAAQHEAAKADQLEELSHSPLADTRKAVALHPATSVDTLSRLSYDPDLQVAAAVAAREEIPESILENLCIRAEADFAMLRGRERSFVLSMIISLANNESVPLERVENLMAKIPGSQLPRVLASESEREDLIAMLAENEKATVRQACAANPGVSDEVLLALCSDENDKVAETAEKTLRESRAELSEQIDQEYRSIKEFQAAQISDNYEEEIAIRFGGKDKVDDIRKFFLDSAPDPTVGKIINPGCADGWLAIPLARTHEGNEVLAADVSSSMLETMEKKAPGLKNLTAIRSDMSKEFPFEKDCAGYICTCAALQHLAEKEEFLHGCVASLQEGGVFAGLFLCIEDDAEDNMILAEEAEGYGFYFGTFDETSLAVATSGLVIEKMGEFTPLPGLTDNVSVEKMQMEHWKEIIGEAQELGCDISNVSFGYILAVGKKISV